MLYMYRSWTNLINGSAIGSTVDDLDRDLSDMGMFFLLLTHASMEVALFGWNVC